MTGGPRPRAAHESTGAGGDRDVSAEVCDFEEYSWLYHESWGDTDVRWLRASVPSCMILDDHDLRDGWNSSYLWRKEMTSQPWWRDRVHGAFGSYFIYQHLGDLAPCELEPNTVYGALRVAKDDPERARILDDFAPAADEDRSMARWSSLRDFGRVRLVFLEVRESR